MKQTLSLRIIRSILRFLFKLIYRIEIDGMENYYKAGKRVVIIANHLSFLDAAIITCFLPDTLTYAVNTQVADIGWVKLFLKLVNAFPIDQTKPLVIRKLIKHVKEDVRCLIFPEGRITVTGAIMKIYEGPGLIADKAHAKILPICLQGAEFTLFSRLHGKVNLRFAPKIKMKIFPPVDLLLDEKIKGRQRRQKISNQLYDIITDMVFRSKNLEKSLFSAFLDTKKIHGKKHIICEDINRQPLNFKKLLLKTCVLGRIISKSTQVRENIGLLLPNSNAMLIGFLALQAYQRIPTMLNFTTGEQSILLACQAAALKQVYSSRKFVEKARLEKIILALEHHKIRVVYLEDVAKKISFFDKLAGAFISHFPSLLTQKSIHAAKDPAVILFTSGSEGEPKGVALSHSNILANCYQISTKLDISPQDRVFNVLPMFHSSGLTVGTLVPLFSGIKVFLYPSPLHYRLVPELVYDTDSTILLGSNVFLYGYARFAHPYDFYTTRLVFAGAEKLKPETRQLWMEKFGIRILEGYGATETAPILTLSTVMQNKIGSVGRFVSDVKYQLKNLPDLKEGAELSVCGPNIMLGYLSASEPNVIKPPENNWYNTGDIVRVDDEGYVFICDRSKRFAKIAGEMVSLGQVENYLLKLWPGFQHAIIATSDLRKGERLILFTTNPNATRKEISNFVRDNGYSELSLPRDIMIIEKMPLMATGKVQYTALMKMVL